MDAATQGRGVPSSRLAMRAKDLGNGKGLDNFPHCPKVAILIQAHIYLA